MPTPREQSFLAAMTGISHGERQPLRRDFHGMPTRLLLMSGRRKAIWRCRLLWPIHTYRAPVSIWLWFGPVFGPCRNEQRGQPCASWQGEAFDQPVPRRTAILMGHILHDWRSMASAWRYSKAYEAMPEAETLIV